MPYAPAAFTPQEIFLLLISVRGPVILRPKKICQRRILMTPPGIEHSTFRLVAQCLRRQRHRLAPVVYNTSNRINGEEGRVKSFRKVNTTEVKKKRNLNICIYILGVFNTKFLFSYCYFVFIFL